MAAPKIVRKHLVFCPWSGGVAVGCSFALAWIKTTQQRALMKLLFYGTSGVVAPSNYADLSITYNYPV